MMADPINLYASFEDGKLIVERQDGLAISMISRDELDSECLEVLEYGSTGQAVKALQALLNAHGQHLDVDGIFGSCTQSALMIFQDQKKLASGICDLQTWEALIRS